MNTRKRYALIFALALLGGAALVAVTWAAPGNAPLAQGGAPAVVSYQGEVRVGVDPYTGNGYFKFAVVNAAGNGTSWSNDGSSAGGSEPTAAVQLAVSDGLFSVLLGDTTLGGMTQALTADVFSQPNRYLRVWFSSDNVTFNQLAPDTRISAVPYALQAQEAADADTVDGLHASELGAHYQNVVVVAKSGGDYTGVQAAIDSISGAAADNPYLVWVAPGVYSETVTMKPYVHLQGAGQEATIITSTASSSAWPPAQATLVLASDASLRDLTVGNGGAGDSNVALLATAGTTRTLVADVTARALGGGVSNLAIVLSGSGTGVTLQQVSALAENGSDYNLGLVSMSGAAAVLRGGSFTGRGGMYTRGIFNFQSGTMLEVESITVLAEGGSNGNFGLYNYGGAEATLRGGAFTGRGGMQTRGIENADSGATLTAENVTALAENGGSENYGLGNYDNAAATLRGGSFIARGGTYAYGISTGANVATLEAESVTALAENGSDANYGQYNFSGAATTLRGGSFTGRGGADAYGIYSSGSDTTLKVESVTALGEGGSSANYGLYNDGSATATADSSQFTGDSDGLYQSGGTVRLGVSQLDGGLTLAGGMLTCFQVYDGNYASYTCP
jgi:hypothetical protein